jgi:hypothetical protein
VEDASGWLWLLSLLLRECPGGAPVAASCHVCVKKGSPPLDPGIVSRAQVRYDNPPVKSLVLLTWPLGGYTHNVTVRVVGMLEDLLKIC